MFLVLLDCHRVLVLQKHHQQVILVVDVVDLGSSPGSKHHMRLECEVHPDWPRSSAAGVHSRLYLWWHLLDRKDSVAQAVQVAVGADLIVLAVGVAWNNDGENAERATLGLSRGQATHHPAALSSYSNLLLAKLTQEIFLLGKPVVLVLQGGHPFALLEYYAQSAAVLSTGFPGQAAGQAITDVLFGGFNPGGRLTMSVPYDAGSLPVYYNQRTTKDDAHIPYYLDIPKPATYSFGYGLSYTTFSQALKGAISTTEGTKPGIFSNGDTIAFSASVTNSGKIAGSHVPQIYLLRRHGSSVTTPDKQHVASTRPYLDAGETATATLKLEVDRFLPVINRSYERVLEAGEYRFALMDDGSPEAPVLGELTLKVKQSFKYEKY
ncbi:glycosyl hydrolase family 3 C-terminal domain-containing protein [Aspergillus carlsbadensis]|nr:glycosyl hydrolase family 3 C-terminal domain-containing protein [Aspergillus carlsbadensis]